MDVGNEFGMVGTFLPTHIIFIRIAIAAILGGIIGFEREFHTAEAGLRTHILIAVAASLFTILAFEIFHTIEDDASRSDPIRAVEAVTAGIAFLGAGAIFRDRGGIQGLTTGAGMWLAGAVGVTTALGHYVVAAATTLLAVIVLAALRAFSHGVLRKRRHAQDEASRGEKRVL